jgi:hypothetical protein
VISADFSKFVSIFNVVVAMMRKGMKIPVSLISVKGKLSFCKIWRIATSLMSPSLLITC